MTRIVIVGNSPLAFFVAQGLNNDIARFTHLEVVWLTADRELSYLPHHRLLAPNRTLRKSAALPNVRVVTDKIRSISLPTKRLITEKRLIEFDLIFLDQTPWYTETDLDEVGQALQRLVVQLKSKKDIRASGAIPLKGQGPLVWQLALLIKSELVRLKNRQVSVEVERPKQRTIADFLKQHGVELELSSRPGFTIAPPTSAFPSKRVKGMRIDRRELAVTDGEGRAARDALVAEQTSSSDRTLWRSLEGQARNWATQIERIITKQELRSIEREPAMFVLTGASQLLLRFDRTISQRVRARLLAKLDRDFWKKLLRRHG